MSPAQRRLIIPIVSFSLGLILLLAALYVTFTRNSQTAIGGVGGPFALVAHDGRVVSHKDFRGAPFLVFFGFTHCPDVCPTTLFEVSEVFRKLGPDKKIAALFITVDPERDTPEKLKDYLANFDKRIIGLTGSKEAITRIVKSYRAYARKVPGKDGQYSMDHSAVVYLMNKRGAFAGGFNIKQKPKNAAAQLQQFL